MRGAFICKKIFYDPYFKTLKTYIIDQKYIYAYIRYVQSIVIFCCVHQLTRPLSNSLLPVMDILALAFMASDRLS